MAAVSFGDGLGVYLAGKKKLTFWEKRVQKILDKPQSERRDRFLKILESRAREHLGVAATAKIDWSSIDWAALLSAILKFLLMILPLFL